MQVGLITTFGGMSVCDPNYSGDPSFRSKISAPEGARMSTIGDVQAAEKKVKEIMENLRKASPKDDTTFLLDELKKATDEYSKAVLELKLP